MKILLPNPDDFEIDDFIDQLELCIYHLKKSWAKIKSKYTVEELEKLQEDGTLGISFRVKPLDEDYDTYFKIIDNRDDQKIELEINTN